MRFYVTLGGKEREAEVRPQDGLFRVRLGKREYTVDFRRIAATHTYSLLVDGRSYAVTAIPEGKELVLKCRGESFRAEVQTERERAAHLIAGKRTVKGPVTIRAVMPGFVTRVLVEAGATVKAGQPLLVVEAMKMQNEVTADVGGVVQEVHVEADQTVKGGDPLVTLETA